MERVTSLFATDPLSTDIGQLIDKATNSVLETEDWQLNMDICDLINQREEGPKDAGKALRKKLQQNAGKNNHAVELILTVTETCVKNCGPRFHAQIATREFLDELVKILNPKNSPSQAVQERVLLLIQSWADAFRGKTELREVERVYQELRAKGVDFPAADLDRMAPIYTPARSAAAPVAQPSEDQRQHASSFTSSNISSPSPNPAGPENLTSQQRAKVLRDLDSIKTNCSVLSDMITSLKPGEEPADELQLMGEIESTCREMQHRLLDLIGSGQIQDEVLVSDMLKLNDDLNGVFLRYERHTRARNQARGVVTGLNAGAAAVPANMSPQKSGPAPPILQAPPPVTSRNSTSRISTNAGATAAPASNLIDFGNESVAGTAAKPNDKPEEPVDEREQLASLFSQSATVSATGGQPNMATQPASGPFTSPYRSTLPPLTASGYEASGVPSINAGLSTAVNARAAGVDLDTLESNLSDVEQWIKQRPTTSSNENGSSGPAPPPRAFEKSPEEQNNPFGL